MLPKRISINRLTACFFLLFADCIGCVYLFLKTYRVLCFSKLTFDQLPIFSPYKWPFSFLRVLTVPYFKLWSELLPNLKFGSGSYDISAIIGLEILNKLISITLQLRAFSLKKVQLILLLNNY